MTERAAAEARHYRWDDMTAEPLKGGISRRLITSERMMIAHVYFKKGDDVPVPRAKSHRARTCRHGFRSRMHRRPSTFR